MPSPTELSKIKDKYCPTCNKTLIMRKSKICLKCHRKNFSQIMSCEIKKKQVSFANNN